MKYKKGLWIFAGVLLIIISAIFYLRDNRNMDKINQAQLESAADSASSKLNQLNEEFEDFDESELEDATLAYDTLQ
ncbi:hypothetical protein DNU06_09820 [Putridiphycobacter roseus]|uniref:Uncharacterized protein n=1 Tax=Putridiphycobacter roseus TaxID=2219161 RepID=A0A2W1MYT0_9FLAO|nr:hypothetical protein [Putridiphycobacter roseus]PZE17037.1 hypothetical protein DNU06_09820 [Putridiphycobacter roseus]